MSTLSTQPVLHCQRCGKQIVVKFMETRRADPNGKLLYSMLRAAGTKALCGDCKRGKLYLIRNNRIEEWTAGREVIRL